MTATGIGVGLVAPENTSMQRMHGSCMLSQYSKSNRNREYEKREGEGGSDSAEFQLGVGFYGDC